METIRRIARCEQGATAIEYGLIVALIAVAIIAAIISLGGTTGNMWNTVSAEVVEASSF
ncbi:MAG: Flp family type IVb pilin [Sphingorhabdus sp.]